MKKFEYTTWTDKESNTDESITKTLDMDGAEGWELVSVVRSMADGYPILTFFLKRPLEE